jgi:hypothetical protein
VNLGQIAGTSTGGRPDGCNPQQPGSAYPSVALAREHEAAARLACMSLPQVHAFEGGACYGGGQMLMRRVA